MSIDVAPPLGSAASSLETAALSRRVATIMRVGIVGAASFWVIGLVLYSLDGKPVDFTSGTPVPLGNFVQELAALNPLAYFLVGFIFLAAAPITRVLISVLHFEHVGDIDYVVITSLVLALLVLTIVIGLLA